MPFFVLHQLHCIDRAESLWVLVCGVHGQGAWEGLTSRPSEAFVGAEAVGDTVHDGRDGPLDQEQASRWLPFTLVLHRIDDY